MIQTKQCTQCNEVKSLDKFYKHSTANDNLDYYCKACKWKKYGANASKRFNIKRKQTPEGFLKYLLGNTRRVHNQKKTTKKQVDIDIKDIVEIYKKQEGRCAISGLEMTYGAHPKYNRSNNYNISIDRIDSSIGYTKDNIQLVCSNINSMKNDSIQAEFLNLCLIIVKNLQVT